MTFYGRCIVFSNRWPPFHPDCNPSRWATSSFHGFVVSENKPSSSALPMWSMISVIIYKIFSKSTKTVKYNNSHHFALILIDLHQLSSFDIPWHFPILRYTEYTQKSRTIPQTGVCPLVVQGAFGKSGAGLLVDCRICGCHWGARGREFKSRHSDHIECS